MIALNTCDCEWRINVSEVKVEKVLSPPQKPVVSNNFVAGERLSCLSPKPKISPTKMQLIILANNVASGKAEEKYFSNNWLMPYRVKLPAPPPIKTANQFILSEFLNYNFADKYFLKTNLKK